MVAATSRAIGSDGAQPYQGTPYVPPVHETPDRSKRCRGNDDTCMAWRAKGTEFCVGHLKAQD